MRSPVEQSFHEIVGSVEVRAGARSSRVPNRNDYVQHLIDQRVIDTEDDLISRGDLVVAAQLDWHRRGQTGCKFAQRLSTAPISYGWRVEVAASPNQGDSTSLARLAKGMVSTAIASSDVEAISILFPQLTNSLELVALLGDLGRFPRWSIDEGSHAGRIGLSDPVNIALRVRLGDSGVLSWLLGFGPFPFLPITRRAPFTELAIRTKVKPMGERFHRITDDRTSAHLADMIHQSIRPAGRDVMWQQTVKMRTAILGGGDDPAAKAKITFSFPRAIWLYQTTVLPLATLEEGMAQIG